MATTLIPKKTCDVCEREELDPQNWKTFDIALTMTAWRPIVDLCDGCTSVTIGQLLDKLEAKYAPKGAPCLR